MTVYLVCRPHARRRSSRPATPVTPDTDLTADERAELHALVGGGSDYWTRLARLDQLCRAVTGRRRTPHTDRET